MVVVDPEAKIHGLGVDNWRKGSCRVGRCLRRFLLKERRSMQSFLASLDKLEKDTE